MNLLLPVPSALGGCGGSGFAVSKFKFFVDFWVIGLALALFPCTMATSSPVRDAFPLDALEKQRHSSSLPFCFASSKSPESDAKWMEIVGGGRAPFRISFRIFVRELFFHIFFPMSYIFVKCFVANSDAFLWNHQLIFFGFYRAKAQACGQSFKSDTLWQRTLLFLSELCRMLWILGLPTALLVGVAVVIHVQQLDEEGLEHLWIAYSYYPEVTLLFVMYLVKTFLVSLKWALFPDSLDDLLSRERVPQDVLLNQQILTQWSPTLVQTVWSKSAIFYALLGCVECHSTLARPWRSAVEDAAALELSRWPLSRRAYSCRLTVLAEMTFHLPNEHPLARHVQMCRDQGELPLVMRPIREIERSMQVGIVQKKPTCVVRFHLTPVPRIRHRIGCAR
jgi:hypothetical protein